MLVIGRCSMCFVRVVDVAGDVAVGVNVVAAVVIVVVVVVVVGRGGVVAGDV